MRVAHHLGPHGASHIEFGGARAPLSTQSARFKTCSEHFVQRQARKLLYARQIACESIDFLDPRLGMAKNKDLSKNDTLDESEFQHVVRFASSSWSKQQAWKRKLIEKSHAWRSGWETRRRGQTIGKLVLRKVQRAEEHAEERGQALTN